MSKILKTRIGPNGEKLNIVEIEDGKSFTLKEAIKMGFAAVSKKEMQKLFTEQELEEMGYNQKDDDNTETKN